MNAESQGVWTTQRPLTGLTRVLIPLGMAAVFASFEGPAIVRGESVDWWLIPVLAFFCGVMLVITTPTIRVAANSGGIQASGFIFPGYSVRWDEVRHLKVVREGRRLSLPAFFFIIGGVNAHDPERLNIGGPFIRVSTSMDAFSASCSNPDEFLEIARHYRPDLLDAEAEEHAAQPAAESAETTTSGMLPEGDPTWITGSFGRDARKRHRVLRAWAPLLALPLLVAGWAIQRENSVAQFMALWFAALVVIILLYRWTLWSSFTVGEDGIRVTLVPGSQMTFRSSSLRGVWIKRENEFSWFDRNLRFLVPGRRTYFGGDAVVLKTAYETREFSVAEADEVLAAVSRLWPDLVSEHGRRAF